MTFGRRVYGEQKPQSGSASGASQPIDIGGGEIAFGKIWSASIEVIRRNPTEFGGMMLLWTAVQCISSLIPSAGSIGVSIAGVFLSIWVTYATSNALLGVEKSEAKPFPGNLFLPVLGLQLLVGFGIAFGVLAVIVPGIFLAVIWSVALPVKVLEDEGVFDSLKRSADLTKGFRWQIFLIMVVLTVAILVLLGLIGLLYLFTPKAVTEFVVIPVFAGVIGTLIPTLFTVLYYQIRNIKEGSTLARVFD